jgi:2-oxoglutarate ferredoxin oxidoreductase subunit gamma
MSDAATQIRFGGLGGQGLVTLGAVLAEAGAIAGRRVAASQAYGSRARGGATRADVILSEEEIDFPHVHHPDLLLVLAQEAYDLYAKDLAPRGVLLADGFFVKNFSRSEIRQVRVPATETALEKIGNAVAANFVMLGAGLGYTRLLDPESVRQAMRHQVNPRFLDVNLKAFDIGLDIGSGIGNQPEVGPWR